MKKSIALFALTFFLLTNSLAQNPPYLSDKAQISVMTCGTGNQLYSAFGHTAFRVQDQVLGLDVVYNYGTFDFDKPNFYLNFAKGKLIYSLSRSSFERFLYSYELEKRWVKEQILDLDQEEVNQLFIFFENNYRPENRDYAYDPLFNNCSSIVGSILTSKFGDAILYEEAPKKIWPFEWGNEKLVTFRRMVHSHKKINSWSMFGIDLAFGGITDREPTLRQQMFLPYQAMYQLRNTTVDGKPLVKRERVVLDYNEFEDNSSFITSPMFWFVFLLLLVGAITYLDWIHGTRNRWLDFSLFLISGLAGTIILLLWLITDHEVTKLNFNFLWLLPTNAILAFYLTKKRLEIPWLKNYCWVAIGGIGIALVIWMLGIQWLSPLFVPLMLILIIRYFLLLKRA